jgi:hypothetical protein
MSGLGSSSCSRSLLSLCIWFPLKIWEFVLYHVVLVLDRVVNGPVGKIIIVSGLSRTWAFCTYDSPILRYFPVPTLYTHFQTSFASTHYTFVWLKWRILLALQGLLNPYLASLTFWRKLCKWRKLTRTVITLFSQTSFSLLKTTTLRLMLQSHRLSAMLVRFLFLKYWLVNRADYL